MAKKMKMMTLFQELEGRAQVTNRRPAAQPSGVYLMQLRTQNGALTLPRRRFSITLDLTKTQPLPQSVKITHVRAVENNSDSGVKPVSVSVNVRQVELPKVGPKAG